MQDLYPLDQLQPLGRALFKEMCRQYPQWRGEPRDGLRHTIETLIEFFGNDPSMVDLYARAVKKAETGSEY